MDKGDKVQLSWERGVALTINTLCPCGECVHAQGAVHLRHGAFDNLGARGAEEV